ncbi:MAG: hypothetical protein ABIN44_07345 [Burkholderiaceae bacterium]
MTTNGWMLVLMLVAGVLLGGFATLRLTRRGFDASLRRATQGVQQQHAQLIDQLRAAQTRAQSELEQSRSHFKRQLATASAEPRAAAARAEERLKAAYEQLDRLRARIEGPETAPNPDLGDGFAATRPMHSGM